MTIEYHVIIIPLFPWETRTPNDFDSVNSLMKVAGRLFSFSPIFPQKEKTAGSADRMTSPENTTKALLSPRRLHSMIHEVGSVHNITSIVKEKAKEPFDTLKIEEAYVSDFAVEIVSSSIDIFWMWGSDLQYDLLSQNLSNFLHNVDEPFPLAISVVACRIIVCDNISELDAIAKKYKLEKIEEGLYVGGEKTPIKYNMFNFISNVWKKIFISNPIATLKPEKLREQSYHRTVDELSFLLSMIHSIGKFYAIFESVRSLCADLEWCSWYLDDVFERYESEFSWLQRNFSNLEKGVYKTEKEIKSQVSHLTKLAASPESVRLIQQIYGVEFLPYTGNFLLILRDSGIKKYNVPAEDIIKTTFNNLKFLAQRIIQFMKSFSDSKNSWRELHRSKITHNRFLLTLLGTLCALVMDILLRLR